MYKYHGLMLKLIMYECVSKIPQMATPQLLTENNYMWHPLNYEH